MRNTPMSTWQSADLQANGLRLHVTRTGGANPPLILAHGFSDDGLCWASVAQVLAAGYDVIMPDARGHGRSETPEQGYDSLEQAADLAGIINALELNQPILLGHSMGAATALALAGRYPGLPRAILLEDPPPFWTDRPDRSAEWEAQQRAWIARLQAQTREQIIAAQHAAAPAWPEADLGPWADSKLRLNLNALHRDPRTAPDWPLLIRAITCPVLLITADTDRGAIVSPAAATALQALLPQVRVAHVAGAGHNIRREQYDEYMRSVGGFLDTLTAES